MAQVGVYNYVDMHPCVASALPACLSLGASLVLRARVCVCVFHRPDSCGAAAPVYTDDEQPDTIYPKFRCVTILLRVVYMMVMMVDTSPES